MTASRGFGGPWAALTAAVALHVTDEALTGFLDLWNAVVLRQRELVPWSPLPTFSFGVWLGGLIALVGVLALLTPVAAQGSRWLVPPAYVFGALMLLNGLGHLGASIYLGRLAPGATSSPLLLAGSVWLLRRLAGSRAVPPPEPAP